MSKRTIWQTQALQLISRWVGNQLDLELDQKLDQELDLELELEAK